MEKNEEHRVRNYGLDLAKEEADRQHTDWIFGAESPLCIALIPQDKREPYMPKGEVQKGREDFMDCATRAPINLLEAKFTWLSETDTFTPEQKEFFKKNGYYDGKRIAFSDRFIAMKSGTTRSGNSLKAPCDAIHRYGLIPKSMLPANRQMNWEQYHNQADITKEMEDLGAKFLSLFSISYERVSEEDYATIIDTDMVVVAGYAWPKPVNGVYPKTSKPANHAFLYYCLPRFTIFDNYEESPGDFVKRLAEDYELVSFGYRLFIGESTETKKISLMLQIIDAMTQLIAILKNRVGAWLS